MNLKQLNIVVLLIIALCAFCDASSKKLGDLSIPKRAQKEPKIINGTEADWEGTRYQISLRLKASDWFFGAGHICGGSLIAANAVLTSGHCVWNAVSESMRNASEFLVVMGNLNRYLNDNATLKFNVKNISVAGNFSAVTFENDLAILHLDGAVPSYLTHVYPIELNEQLLLEAGTNCTVSGWGKTETGFNADNLMVADVAIINKTECSANYDYFLRDGMICAGYMEGKRDACTGDSGGPLVCGNRLAGVVSFGVGCAEPGFPGIYADVANYADWIRAETDLPPVQSGAAALQKYTVLYSSWSLIIFLLINLQQTILH